MWGNIQLITQVKNMAALLLVLAAVTPNPAARAGTMTSMANGTFQGGRTDVSAGDELWIWPRPARSSRAAGCIRVRAGGPTLSASGAGAATDVVQAALARYAGIFRVELQGGAVAAAGYDALRCRADAPVLEHLTLHVVGQATAPSLGVDESFVLNISSTATGGASAQLAAPTAFGALHGLEAFSQLLRPSAGGPSTTRPTAASGGVINASALLVRDKPRFAWRGLLVDSGRHFLPVSVLKPLLDAMAYNRLNVLHWHMTDNQAFPAEMPSHPRLSEFGAYSPRHVYSIADVHAVREYARLRGVRVVFEFDMPGHSASWAAGYPGLFPHCPDSSWWQRALDPTREATFEFVEALLADVARMAGDDEAFIHIGGDEVDGSCWLADPAIVTWMAQHNMTGDTAALQGVFQDRVAAMAGPLNKTFVVWEEAWGRSSAPLPKGTVVQVWRDQGEGLVEAVRAGYRAIFSPDVFWYMDKFSGTPAATPVPADRQPFANMETDWWNMYRVNPTANLTESESVGVLGGEACMWSAADATNLFPITFPRASAVAEVLWSPEHHADAMPTMAETGARLNTFRCRLLRRGIPAASPGHSQSIADLPGFCGVPYEFEYKAPFGG